ncbi:HPr kinase/phosphorylase [Jiella sonneratiae]|uniref:HPr kinase/phosphatase C-terminal domain-containing protein n=1 Tax=Jiella sonneratiae TaxID=2816856 RepID=A0ABS3J683_9HYPH|nr:HPr kinase/phosphatase C-terminal domain-containing protein [Jiella sonneratiae]MBO0905157.1 HPr kinase/phosphatase C-terminal domain-containing protein [Jiella sonneratiae]
MTAAVNIHASAVALGGRGVLIRGPAGSGKSALVLSLLRRAPPPGLRVEFVADDRVVATLAEGVVQLSAPDGLKGLLEIAGVGIVREPALPSVALWLVADLVPQETMPRHPAPLRTEIAGVEAPLLRLPRKEAALSADILLTLAASGDLPG